MPGAPWGSLPVLLGLLLWHPAGASGPCWETTKCRDLASEAGVLVSWAMGTALWSLWFLTPPTLGTAAAGWGGGDGDAVTPRQCGVMLRAP